MTSCKFLSRWSGVPEAKFKWFLSAVDGVVHEGAQYVINNVQLNHIGLYSCQAINDLGAGNAASEYLDVTGEKTHEL